MQTEWVTYAKVETGDRVRFLENGRVWMNRAQAEKSTRPFLLVATVETTRVEGWNGRTFKDTTFVTETGEEFRPPMNAKALRVAREEP